MSEPRISVVLPVYNQADHIGPVIDGYRLALESANLSFELLPIINGKRKDDSDQICRALSEKHPSIRTFVTDQGGWVHYCPTGNTLYYEITNDGGVSTVFTVTLQIISWSQ